MRWPAHRPQKNSPEEGQVSESWPEPALHLQWPNCPHSEQTLWREDGDKDETCLHMPPAGAGTVHSCHTVYWHCECGSCIVKCAVTTNHLPCFSSYLASTISKTSLVGQTQEWPLAVGLPTGLQDHAGHLLALVDMAAPTCAGRMDACHLHTLGPRLHLKQSVVFSQGCVWCWKLTLHGQFATKGSESGRSTLGFFS